DLDDRAGLRQRGGPAGRPGRLQWVRVDREERSEALGLDRLKQALDRDAERAQPGSVDVRAELELPGGWRRGQDARELGCRGRLGGPVGLVPEDEGALRLAHGLRQAGDADGEAPGRRPHVGAHGGEGLRARAHDDDPGATPGRLAHAELDDRLLVGRVAADHDDEVRLVQVAELRPGPRAQRAEPVAGDAEAADARAGEQAHELARQEALLDGRAGPDQDARRGGAAEHDRGGVDGLLERDLAYLVALPDEPVAQAVGRPAERVAPAALVADPPLLDRVVRLQAAG